MLAQAPGWATTARGAPLLCQFRLSGAELEQVAPRCGQGRMASGRVVPVRRVYRHQPGTLCRGHRARASSTSRKASTRSSGPGCHARPSPPTPCVSSSTRSPITSATSCAPWRCEDGAAVVADQPAREADQDQRQGRQPQPLRDLPDGRGRVVAADVRRHPVADRRAAGTACAGMSGAGSCAPDIGGEVCLDASKRGVQRWAAGQSAAFISSCPLRRRFLLAQAIHRRDPDLETPGHLG
jgi:hypothetical protein